MLILFIVEAQINNNINGFFSPQPEQLKLSLIKKLIKLRHIKAGNIFAIIISEQTKWKKKCSEKQIMFLSSTYL